jgi:hypothetical protein
MTATAELIQLPVAPTLRLPAQKRQAHERYPDTSFARHRIYREPHGRRRAILSYSSSGLVTLDPQKGRTVDLYA